MIDYDPHRWWRNFLAVRGSMVRDIFVRVLVVVVWAAAVTIVDHRVVQLRIPLTLHNLIGVALGLLLVFRTNASYDRFWARCARRSAVSIKRRRCMTSASIVGSSASSRKLQRCS